MQSALPICHISYHISVTSDTTRYHYIVQALDQDTATRVLDLLLQPPATEKYQAQYLLDTFTLSNAQRANLLLNMPSLSDSKPSQLMDKMLALLGDHPPCFLFWKIFLQQLPIHIRAHLVQVKLTDCWMMALAADALWTASGSTAPRKNKVSSMSVTLWHILLYECLADNEQ